MQYSLTTNTQQQIDNIQKQKKANGMSGNCINSFDPYKWVHFLFKGCLHFHNLVNL